MGSYKSIHYCKHCANHPVAVRLQQLEADVQRQKRDLITLANYIIENDVRPGNKRRLPVRQNGQNKANGKSKKVARE